MPSKTFTKTGYLPYGYPYFGPEISIDYDTTPYINYYGDEIGLDIDGVPYLKD